MEDNMVDRQTGTPAVADWLDGGACSPLKIFFLLFIQLVAAQEPESFLGADILLVLSA